MEFSVRGRRRSNIFTPTSAIRRAAWCELPLLVAAEVTHPTRAISGGTPRRLSSHRNRRSRRRQRNLRGNFGFGGLAHVPLTHPIALCALDQIEMDVRFMLRIRARAEDR